MFSKTSIFIAGWVILLATVSVAGYWFLFVRSASVHDSATISEEHIPTPFEIINALEGYRDVRMYTLQGDTTKARNAFLKLQAAYAPGTLQRQAVDYNFARFYLFTVGDAASGASMLKDMAANQTYTPEMRAYALESLGTATLVFRSDLRNVLFMDEPFAKALDDARGDYDRAATALFSMAVEIYPTALAALRVAQDSANRLESGKDTLSLEEKDRLRATYKQYMEIADREVGVFEADAQLHQPQLSHFYMVKAMTGDAMARAGEPVDVSDIVHSFERALTFREAPERSFVLLRFAMFLCQFGDVARSRVDEFVDELTHMPSADRALLETSIKNALSERNGQYEPLMRLMDYSPAFRTYTQGLLSSGADTR